MNSPLPAIVLALLLVGDRAAAEWGPNGEALSTNVTPSESGSRTNVATFPGSQFVPPSAYAVWAGGSPSRVFVNSVLDGPASPVAACDGSCADGGTQKDPVAAVDQSGVLFVAWEDSRSGFAVYAQAFCPIVSPPFITPAPGWPSARNVSFNRPTDTPKTALAIAAVVGGGVFVAWEDGSGATLQIAGSFVRSNVGCSQFVADSAFLLAPTAGGDQTNPDVATDGAGGALVVWQQARPSPNRDDIYGQHVASSGVIQWGTAGGMICGENESQMEPAIATDGAGGAIVAWRGRGMSDEDVYATRICTNGGTATQPRFRWGSGGCTVTNPNRRTVCTAIGDQTFPVIVSDGVGGALIAWEDARSIPGGENRYAVYCQRLDANGEMATVPGGRTVWTTNGVLALSADVDGLSHYRPTIASDGEQGANIAWYNYAQDIYVQRVGKGGHVGIDPTLVCDDPPGLYIQIAPAIGAVSGGSVTAWHDRRFGTHDAFGTRRNNRGEVAVAPAPSVESRLEAWPNPFRNRARLRLTLVRRERVVLEVFDLLGRRIRTIASGLFDPGPHAFEWDGRSDRGPAGPAGVYVVRARAGDRIFQRRLVRVR